MIIKKQISKIFMLPISYILSTQFYQNNGKSLMPYYIKRN